MTDDELREFWDYHESVHVYCEIEGCGWTAGIDWPDLEKDDAPSSAAVLYRAHWELMHRVSSDTENPDTP